MSRRLLTLIICSACLPLTLAAFTVAGVPIAEDDVPLGLEPVEHPEDNPPTPEKIALGKQLYFDKRLSRDKDVSCASCHDPEKGWSNDEQFATGFQGKQGDRNSPTILNSAYHRFQFWDGRAATLEDQALGPVQNPIEMNMSLDEVVERLNQVDGYRRQFQDVFGTGVTADGIAKAIGAFERTILAGDSPWDRYEAGDKSALSESAKRGMDLFFGKAVCSSCHSGHNFTDNAFHNIGVGMNAESPDIGREKVSGLGGDRGSFKTPTLRDIARTAPYMHDGSMETLEEVVEHYDRGGIENPWLDEEIFPLDLTEQEKADLVQFLKEGLTSNDYPMVEPPELP